MKGGLQPAGRQASSIVWGAGPACPSGTCHPPSSARQARHLRNLDAAVQEIGHLRVGGGTGACACCRLGWIQGGSHPTTAPCLPRLQPAAVLRPERCHRLQAAPGQGCRTCRTLSQAPLSCGRSEELQEMPVQHTVDAQRKVSAALGLAAVAARRRPLPPAGLRPCSPAAPFLRPGCAPAPPLPHLHRTTL